MTSQNGELGKLLLRRQNMSISLETELRKKEKGTLFSIFQPKIILKRKRERGTTQNQREP